MSTQKKFAADSAADADAEGLVDDSTTDREFETEVGWSFVKISDLIFRQLGILNLMSGEDVDADWFRSWGWNLV